MRFITVLTVLFMLGGAAYGNETVMQGREAYYQGVKGDTEAVDRAIDIFSALFEETGDIWHESMLGSAYILKARDADLMGKMSCVKNGLNHLDHAAADEDATLWVRWERGVSSMNLPGIFGRGNDVEADFEYCIKASKKPDKKDLELLEIYMGNESNMKDAEGMFRYYYVRALAKNGKTKAAVKAAGKIPGDSPFYDKTQQLMKELTEK